MNVNVRSLPALCQAVPFYTIVPILRHESVVLSSLSLLPIPSLFFFDFLHKDERLGLTLDVCESGIGHVETLFQRL